MILVRSLLTMLPYASATCAQVDRQCRACPSMAGQWCSGIGIACQPTGRICTPTISPSRDRRIYADTCIESRTGDVAGHVITLAGRGRGRVATLQWSEGALRAPVAALVAYARDGRGITITAQTEWGRIIFVGRIAGQRLSGVLTEPWAGKARRVDLVQRFARSALPACRLLGGSRIG